MAEIAPLHALHYDLGVAGPLQELWAPPYDVIDAAYRAELAERSPYNAVRVDLPQAGDGGDPYSAAAGLLARWEAEGAVTRDGEPAIWALEQSYRAPGHTRRVVRAETSSAADSSAACAPSPTAPVACARTSAPTRVPRRTGCG